MSIEYLEFDIFSDRDLLQEAVCEITKTKTTTGPGSVYDERMGPMSDKKICITCDKEWRMCPGHFGYIDLKCYIVHPLFQKTVRLILESFCHMCYSCILQPEHYNLEDDYESSTFESRLAYIKSKSKCRVCSTDIPKVNITNNEVRIDSELVPIEKILKILSNIPQEELEHFGIPNLKPDSFIISKFPVTPTRSRPPTFKNGNICDDTTTENLIQIIKITQDIEKDKDKHIAKLYFHISTHIDNSQNKNTRNNSISLKGIKERISGKGGLIRENLIGKRTNQSARTVVGPDVDLHTDQVLIPTYFSQKLTFTEIVNDINLFTLQNLVDQGRANFVIRDGRKYNLKYALYSAGTKLECGDIVIRKGKEFVPTKETVIKEGDEVLRGNQKLKLILPSKKNFKLVPGDRVLRWLKNDDIVLLNRQPTLHKGSFYFLRVKILECCKPGICKGTCKTCSIKNIRVPMSICASMNADMDGDELNINAPSNIKAATEIKLLGGLESNLHSSQTGGLVIKLTQDGILGSYKMTKENIPVDEVIYSDIVTELYFQKIPVYPKGVNNSSHSVFSILFPPSLFYRNEEIVIENGRIISGLLTKKTLGSGPFSLPTMISREYGAKAAMDFVSGVQFMVKIWLRYYNHSVSIADCLIRPELQEEIEAILETNLSQTRREERNTMKLLNNTKESAMRVVKDTFAHNQFADLIESGAKGSIYNVTQISSLLGQQLISGRRIAQTLPHNKENLSQREKYKSRGFVEHSFLYGLSPQDFWYHSMSGRESVVDTVAKTPDSGYLFRKMARIMENVIIQYDGTVRDCESSILSFTYGNNNLDCSKEIGGSFCDIYSIVNKLNNSYK